MMKGRIIQGKHNKQYALKEFFDNNNRLKCPECGCLLDPYYRSLYIDFKSKLEFSVTYEGVFIVNKRFKEYIQSEGYANVIFFPVNQENDFFYFHVINNIVDIDTIKSGILFKERCGTCNYPKEIVGGIKVFAMEDKSLSDGFFTTDLYWRTHYCYNPWILIGESTCLKLKAQKFQGLNMEMKVF